MEKEEKRKENKVGESDFYGRGDVGLSLLHKRAGRSGSFWIRLSAAATIIRHQASMGLMDLVLGNRLYGALLLMYLGTELVRAQTT